MFTQTKDAYQSNGLLVVAGLTFLFAVGLPIAAILTAGAREVEIEPGAVDWIFVATIAVVTALVFGLLVPRALRDSANGKRMAKVGLSLSGIALIAVVAAFWTMIPVIFGTAGAYLGYEARQTTAGETTGRRWVPTAAMIIGGLAAIASVAAYVATS